jgi:hypothetical protein
MTAFIGCVREESVRIYPLRRPFRTRSDAEVVRVRACAVLSDSDLDMHFTSRKIHFKGASIAVVWLFARGCADNFREPCLPNFWHLHTIQAVREIRTYASMSCVFKSWITGGARVPGKAERLPEGSRT